MKRAEALEVQERGPWAVSNNYQPSVAGHSSQVYKENEE